MAVPATSRAFVSLFTPFNRTAKGSTCTNLDALCLGTRSIPCRSVLPLVFSPEGSFGQPQVYCRGSQHSPFCLSRFETRRTEPNVFERTTEECRSCDASVEVIFVGLRGVDIFNRNAERANPFSPLKHSDRAAAYVCISLCHRQRRPHGGRYIEQSCRIGRSWIDPHPRQPALIEEALPGLPQTAKL